MHGNIVLDKEFQDLLPPLDSETYRMLEESILGNGVLNPLVTWNDGNGEILIDGYNRYSICTEHDIPFETVGMEFSSREDVIIWIISNQVARRNLSPMQLSYFRGVHYRSEKINVTNEKGINRYSAGKTLTDTSSEHQSDPAFLAGGQNVPQLKKQKTADRIGAHYKVSGKTIKRDEQVADAIDAIGKASPEVKRKILIGEAKIPKKYLKLATSEDYDVAQLAAELEAGTFERKKPGAAASGSEGDGTAQSGTEVSNTVEFGESEQTEQSEQEPPIAFIHTEVAVMEATIIKTLDILNSERSTIDKAADKAELRAVLQACIARLEEAYGLI